MSGGEGRTKRSREEAIATLQACVAEIEVGKEVIPENLRSRDLLFGVRNDKLRAVIAIQATSDEITSPDVQSYFCGSIGVCMSQPMHMMVEMSKGRVPDNVVVMANDRFPRLLWFASNVDSKVAVIDIAMWDALPGMKFFQYGCVARSLRTRLVETKDALQNLSYAVETVKECLTDASFKTIQDHLKSLFDACEFV